MRLEKQIILVKNRETLVNLGIFFNVTAAAARVVVAAVVGALQLPFGRRAVHHHHIQASTNL